MIEEKRKIRYIMPTRVVAHSDSVDNAEDLLIEKDPQPTLVFSNKCMTVHQNGWIILDFGKEIAGGIRISSHAVENLRMQEKIRIRFGESVGETCADIGEKGACNNHGPRDFETTLTMYGDMCTGDTGFRFVRIDFFGEANFGIKSIFAKEWYEDFEQVKEFKSNDELVNQIFETAKRTVTLCTQHKIWDGIKRDRLVWIGDMEPEVHSLLHLYGPIPQIEESINFSEQSFPLPTWMNNMPTYSIWYLLIVYDVYTYNKDKAFVDRHIDYVQGVINQFNECVDENGFLDETKYDVPLSMPYFIDWPTEAEPEEDKRSASVDLLKYTLPKVRDMLLECGKTTLKLDNMLSKLNKYKTKAQSKKQLAALHYLVEKDDESYNTLIEGGAKGLSTFMSYYILTAIADRDLDLAINIMKEYYGGMLSRGATTFWEDFDVEWLEGSGRIDEITPDGLKDLHGDYGKYCYKGFRHSLCHGWSSGPVSFLYENEEKIK